MTTKWFAKLITDDGKSLKLICANRAVAETIADKLRELIPYTNNLARIETDGE